MVKKSIIQWVKSVLLLDLVFWILVGAGCVKDAVSCLEGATFLPYFFYLPFSRIPQPWLNGLQNQYVLMFSAILFLLFWHLVLGIFLGYIFKNKHVKWATSIVISFIIIIGSAFAFGYIGLQQELRESTVTRTIAVTSIEDGMLNYFEVEWYVGEAAIEAAKNDGCVEGCAPGGFYMKMNTSFASGVNVDQFKNTKITLLKQPDMSPEVVSFDKYLEARLACKMDFESCEYYGIGAEYEYFDATFNNGGFVSMIEKYVP